MGGGGGLCAALLQGRGWGAPGGAGWGSLCLGPPLCLSRAGSKPGPSGVAQSSVGVAPILHRLTSACRCLAAVSGVPLRADAEQLAFRGHRQGGRAADWAVHGVQAQWHPSPGAAALSGGAGPPLVRQGGCGASVPVAGLRPSVGSEGTGGRQGGVALELSAVPLRSIGASLRWLPGVGLKVWAPAPPVAGGSRESAVVGRGGAGEGGRGDGPRFRGRVPGGGATPGRWPAPLPCPPSGHKGLGRRAGPHPRPPRPSQLSLLVAWHRRGGEWGGGRRAPGAAVRVRG